MFIFLLGFSLFFSLFYGFRFLWDVNWLKNSKNHVLNLFRGLKKKRKIELRSISAVKWTSKRKNKKKYSKLRVLSIF